MVLATSIKVDTKTLEQKRKPRYNFTILLTADLWQGCQPTKSMSEGKTVSPKNSVEENGYSHQKTNCTLISHHILESTQNRLKTYK